MVGFPKERRNDPCGDEPGLLAGPVSLSSYVFHQQGPGPQNVERRKSESQQRTARMTSVDPHLDPWLGGKVKGSITMIKLTLVDVA